MFILDYLKMWIKTAIVLFLHYIGKNYIIPENPGEMAPLASDNFVYWFNVQGGSAVSINNVHHLWPNIFWPLLYVYPLKITPQKDKNVYDNINYESEELEIA